MFKRNYVRIMPLLAVILAIATVTYVNANGQGGYAEELNPDGTGWKVHWDWNEVQTASATASIYKDTGRNVLCIRYTDVLQFASYSTKALNSNNEENTGVRYLWTAKTGPENETYRGHESDHLLSNVRAWFLTPDNAGGTASARVDPNGVDDDAGEVSVDM